MHRRCSGVGVLTENERRNYFERGIRVCARWNDFWTFLTDMGRTQCWHGEVSIDRIDGDSDYTPDNCRWATSKTQVRNSRAVKLNPAKVKEIRRQIPLAGASRKALNKHPADAWLSPRRCKTELSPWHRTQPEVRGAYL
jgi:hypothetical protein